MRTIIIGFFGVVLATTNAKAAIGENIAELIARYGEPETGSAPDLAVWKTKQGQVFAELENGKAVIMVYTGGIDETTKSALLEQNLPKDQKWVDGKAFKDWRQLSDNPGLKEIDKAQSWETTDGTIWAVYSPEEKTFEVGTAEAWKMLVKGAESLFEGFVFEPFKGKVPAQYANDPESDLSGADQDFITDVAQEDAMNELEQNPNAYKGKETSEIEKIGHARALRHNLKANDALRYQGAFRQVIEDPEGQHH
jgi:hypothetical protein